MSKQIDVSFLVSVYNPRRDYFLETVKSIVRVMREASCSSELLLCDDGSPQDCSALLEEAKALDAERITVWRSPENRGIGRSRCAMVEKSRGRYVASFDQDDLMLPFGLDRVVNFLDEHTDYSASYARKWLFNENGLTGEVHGNLMSRFNMLFSPKVNINAMLIRRQELLAHDSFLPCPDSPINDDVFLMIRLGVDTDLHYDAEIPRCLYRVHRAQNSRRYDELNRRDFAVMCQYVVDRYPELYWQIVSGDIPECTPENSRIVQELTGVAVFLNQRNHALATRLCRLAVARHPEDIGAWEHLLLMLSGSAYAQEWEETYKKANRLFADNPDALFILILTANARAANLFGSVPEELRQETARLQARCWAAPRIVLDNLPAPAGKAVYSLA